MLEDKEKQLAAAVRKRVLEELEYETDVTDEKMEEMVSRVLEEELKKDL